MFCPRAIARSIFSFNRSLYQREDVSLPTTVFSPTRMQPSVSAAVFPGWMRTPEKYGTSSSKGSLLQNLGDMVYATLYVPAGMAVFPGTFPSLGMSRTASSSVLQKNMPSMYIRPMVYADFLYFRCTFISMSQFPSYLCSQLLNLIAGIDG